MDSPSNLLQNFDADLQKFYSSVIAKELNFKVKHTAQLIRKALKEVVDAYKVEVSDVDDDSRSRTIRFNTSSKRCAYVLKHSSCFTSAVARHLLKVTSCNKRILEECFLRGELNICCLGGGPATDAVAVIKTITSVHGHRSTTDRELTVNVTIVDINEDWEMTARNVLTTLRKRTDLFGVTRLNFRFLRANLTEPMEPEVIETLMEADVVTMVYFLSAVNGGKYMDESLIMVQKIMSILQPGCLLFFLDSARKVNYHQMSEAASSLSGMEQLCKPRLEEFHTLSIASIKKFIEIYRRHFGRMLCMTNCFVSSSAWIKLGDAPWTATPTLCLSGKCLVDSRRGWRENDFEKFERSTRKMLAFRARVQRVLEEQFESTREDDDDLLLDDDVDPYDLCVYNCVPVCLLQTKPKRKRIFTGYFFSL